MSWFFSRKSDPAELQRDAAMAADKAWLQAGDYSTEYREFTIPITFKCCGNHEIMRERYKAHHNKDMPYNVGKEYFWASAGATIESAKVDLYLVVKKTRRENRIINKWAAGHGVMRILNLGYRLMGIHFGNATDTDKPDYFGA